MISLFKVRKFCKEYKEEGGTLTFKEWRSYVRNA